MEQQSLENKEIKALDNEAFDYIRLEKINNKKSMILAMYVIPL